MKIYILLALALLSFACNNRRQTASANSDQQKTTYTEPEKLEQAPEYVAEQAKHEKWKEERDAYLKRINDLEKKRVEAIRKCEADRLKPRPANANTEVDEPDAKQLTCEEQYPPVFEKDLYKAATEAPK